jgi:hypothetical protein
MGASDSGLVVEDPSLLARPPPVEHALSRAASASDAAALASV